MCLKYIFYKNSTFSRSLSYSIARELEDRSRELYAPQISRWYIHKSIETVLTTVLTPIVKKNKISVFLINGFVEEYIVLNIAHNIFKTLVTHSSDYTILDVKFEDVYASKKVPKLETSSMQTFIEKFEMNNLTEMLTIVIDTMNKDQRLDKIVALSYTTYSDQYKR